MPPMLRTLYMFGAQDQILAVAASVLVVAGLVFAARSVHKAMEGTKADDVTTFAAAVMATGISMTSTWRFAGQWLHFSGVERSVLFAFGEVLLITCAIRARRNIEKSASHTAGADGAVIWLVSFALGVVGIAISTSGAEAFARFLFPVGAAWLWERSLIPARQDADSKPWWQKLIEQARVRLGMADRPDVPLSEQAIAYRLMRVARASVRAEMATFAPSCWWWTRRTRTVLVVAVERTDLGTNPDRVRQLHRYRAVLRGTQALIDHDPGDPWEPPVEPDVPAVEQAASAPADSPRQPPPPAAPRRAVAAGEKPPLPATDEEIAAYVTSKLGAVPVPSATAITKLTKQDFASQAGTAKAARVRDLIADAAKLRSATAK